MITARLFYSVFRLSITVSDDSYGAAKVGRHLLQRSADWSRCPLWVNRGLAIQPQRCPLSVVSPIADKRGRSWFVR
jgi:hypothetical protein